MYGFPTLPFLCVESLIPTLEFLLEFLVLLLEVAVLIEDVAVGAVDGAVDDELKTCAEVVVSRESAAAKAGLLEESRERLEMLEAALLIDSGDPGEGGGGGFDMMTTIAIQIYGPK